MKHADGNIRMPKTNTANNLDAIGDFNNDAEDFAVAKCDRAHWPALPPQGIARNAGDRYQ